MSELPVAFSVVLHHLSPDARRAGIELAEVQLTDVSLWQLRALLNALTELAPKVAYPVTPEMRITSEGRQFLVQVRDGRVRFSSWSVRSGGGDLTPAQILALIAGTDEAAAAPAGATAGAGDKRRRRRIWLIAFIAGGVLGSNGLTAWMLTRPAPDLLPVHRLLEPDPAQRLLERAAGVYETGQTDGDRRLNLRRDGTVQWFLLGEGKMVVEETTLSTVAAEAGGQPALLAGNRTMIEVRNAATLVYFGDTYRRVPP